MDQEMIAYFDERFRETSRQIAEFREETNQRFERGEETARQTLVLLEGLRHDTQIIAESMVGLFDRQDRLQSELMLELHKVKEWFSPYYRTLDSRLGVLERQAEHREENAMDTVRRLVDQMRRESLI